MPLRPPPNLGPAVVEADDEMAAVRVYVGQAIRAERSARGMSGEQLALKLGVTRPTLTMWETGHGAPSFASFLRLCILFPALVDVLADLAGQLRGSDTPGLADVG